MHNLMHGHKQRILTGIVVAAGLLVPSLGHAAGTLFMLEVQGGLHESAFSGASPGLAYGVSAGPTLKLKGFPVRWYLLGTVIGRNSSVEGRHLGINFEADRQELDLFFSQRTVVPVWQHVRVYFETGLGHRQVSQRVRRGEQLGSLSESSGQLLVVLALGLQARLSESFSIGVRGEMTPLDNEADLTSFAADLQPEPNRLSLFAQVGVHF